jgi:predicted Rossmann-fold nucleotide-binding protein
MAHHRSCLQQVIVPGEFGTFKEAVDKHDPLGNIGVCACMRVLLKVIGVFACMRVLVKLCLGRRAHQRLHIAWRSS